MWQNVKGPGLIGLTRANISRLPRVWPPAYVPGAALPLPIRRRVRLLALVAVRDEMRYLPDFIANVAPQVDGTIALDDGSTDGSGDFLASRPEVLELVRASPGRTGWDEPENHRKLIEAGRRHGAEWLLAIDADERVEHDFRRRAERVIRVGAVLGVRVFAVRLLDLWDTPCDYRVDAHWGRQTRGRLFAAHPQHEFDQRPLHHVKAPLQHRDARHPPAVGLRLYHLRMINAADRRARQHRYEAADPDRRWQEAGYGHMTDERGLRLRRVGQRRRFSSN
jgi:hypothetical protein